MCEHHPCPRCGSPRPALGSHPFALCPRCAQRARAEDGRLLRLDLGAEGLSVHYAADGRPWRPGALSVDGRPCRALRHGDQVVLELLAPEA